MALYETIRLEKGMYGTGKSFTQTLESLDPSENYEGTALGGLDAYQRQLKRFGIRVSGAGSDAVEKFFQTGDSAALFPEYVTRAVRQGMERADLLPGIVATVTNISSMDYRTSAGLRVHSDSYDSTVGRIGLVLGHNMVHGDRSTNVYGKIMYEKELGGDVTYRLNGVPVKEDFGGSWWTYGIGVTGQFGADKTYYLEVQRSDGDRFDQEWQINAGLRWSF